MTWAAAGTTSVAVRAWHRWQPMGGMDLDVDRVAEALRRFILAPSEPVERRWDTPDALVVRTPVYRYRAKPANWLIAREPWVRAAIRVIAESDRGDLIPIFGLLFTDDRDDATYLNDVEAFADLGRRLSSGMDPLAYAELLAELHFPSGTGSSPVSHPMVAGQLIRDSGTFLAKHQYVDPSVVAAGPTVSHAGGRMTIAFQSYVRYLLPDFGSALTIFDWIVSAPDRGPATWASTVAADRIEVTR